MPVLWDAGCEGGGLSCRRHAFARCERVPLGDPRRAHPGNAKLLASYPFQNGFDLAHVTIASDVSNYLISDRISKLQSWPEEYKRLGCGVTLTSNAIPSPELEAACLHPS